MSCFQHNLNQGAIQLWRAFVNTRLTFLSMWHGLQRGFPGSALRLIRRGDELLPRSLSSSGFKSRRTLRALRFSVHETSVTLILGPDGHMGLRQSYVLSLRDRNVGFLAAERQKISYRENVLWQNFQPTCRIIMAVVLQLLLTVVVFFFYQENRVFPTELNMLDPSLALGWSSLFIKAFPSSEQSAMSKPRLENDPKYLLSPV